jgi:Fe2+ transport system protein FeoA
MTCSLCGLRYSEIDAAIACKGCPFVSGDCALLKCPNCGFEQPALRNRSNVSSWFRTVFRKRDRLHKKNIVSKKEGAMTLLNLTIGNSAIIEKLNTTNRNMLRKFLAMGMLPGSRIVLERKKPIFLISLRNSKFAMDRSMAETVIITDLEKTL